MTLEDAMELARIKSESGSGAEAQAFRELLAEIIRARGDLGRVVDRSSRPDGLTIRQGSVACPEAYDVLDVSGAEVGYLRLRNGTFTASVHGDIVYRAYPQGDGIFDSDEREGYLCEALWAVKHELVKRASSGD